MKKIIYTIFTLFIGVVLGMTSTTFAAPVKEYVQASFEKVTFVVNGETKKLDADPLVYQGTTYLPVRIVLNALGYDVGYKADTKTVTADKSIESLTQELDKVLQKGSDSVPIVNNKSKEEKISELTRYLNAQKASLSNMEMMVKKINERTDLSEEDKEFAIDIRMKIIESTKKIIEETEAKLAELQE